MSHEASRLNCRYQHSKLKKRMGKVIDWSVVGGSIFGTGQTGTTYYIYIYLMPSNGACFIAGFSLMLSWVFKQSGGTSLYVDPFRHKIYWSLLYIVNSQQFPSRHVFLLFLANKRSLYAFVVVHIIAWIDDTWWANDIGLVNHHYCLMLKAQSLLGLLDA
jgi:hypothetical protein